MKWILFCKRNHFSSIDCYLTERERGREKEKLSRPTAERIADKSSSQFLYLLVLGKKE